MELHKLPDDEEDVNSISLKENSRKRRKRMITVAVIVCSLAVVAIALGVGLGLGLNQGDSDGDGGGGTPTPAQAPDRIDCYPEAKWGAAGNVSQAACEERGCEYDPVTLPNCFMSPESPLGSGYDVTSDSTDAEGVRRITLRARQVKRSTDGQQQQQQQRALDKAESATVEVQSGGENILRFKLSPDGPRYEVPKDILDIRLPPSRPGLETSFEFKVTNTTPFAFQVIRRSTGTVLWDTGVGGTSVGNQFLTISSRLPSINVYGFGENSHKTFRHDLNYVTWPLFARDQWVGQSGQNHYGVHPFYTCLETTGHSHGVLLLNSNAMDYSFTPLPMLTYRTIGGVLDFYVFLGPTPENVIQQYTQLIGRPYMPPYWALGFQLCRYGYKTIERMQDAVNRTLSAGIPQDIQYADIDHMNESMIFTIDNDNFHGLADYFTELRNGGMRTIIILDPCMISNVSDYEPFKLGMENDIFIKWPNQSVMPPEDFALTNTTTLLGYVWPKGKVAFPDFFLPQTQTVWSELIVKHRKLLPFDGLWIDMNEPANFGTNEVRPWNWPESAKPYWSLKCPTNHLDDPAYRTMAAYTYDAEAMAANRSGARLSDKTLCMFSVQGVNATHQHYDVHNLYGASQIASTLSGLRNASGGERGIVVGRSTFPGTGSQMGHWLGDNFSEWPHLKYSIIGMLEFNLFGFPYIGADICGFFGNTTAEMCKRWMQLGAFYPYSRNHNQIDSAVDQDPANFNEEVTRLSREALLIRYSLLPYLYTLFHRSHTRGDTVVRPLHHEFPSDQRTWSIDEQFLWGPALLIVPILHENQNSLDFYLPSGRWYDFYTNKSLNGASEETRTILPNSSIPLFLRGGFIFPTQDPANNTHYSRLNPFRFLVYLDENDGRATGELFWDDGISVDTYERGMYYFALTDCSKSEFRLQIQKNLIPQEMETLRLESVHVVGLTVEPVEVEIIGSGGGATFSQSFNYTNDTQRLVVWNLKHRMDSDLTLRWRSSPSPTAAEAERVDCMPEGGEDETKCLSKGCLWNASSSANVPWCFINSSSYGYSFVNVSDKNSTHDTVHLQHLPGASMFGNDSQQVVVYLDSINDWLLRIKISPVNVGPVFEVPVPLHLPETVNSSTRLYSVVYDDQTGQKPFNLQVNRRDGGQAVVWDTSLGGLTVSPQFLQLVARLPSTFLYGLGENSRSSFRRSFDYETIAMFSRDQPPGDPKANLYGVHPYYVCVDNVTTGSAHGVLLLNSNAMEIVLGPAPSVTYRTIGGLLDFYLIFGDNSETVTKRYTQLVGRTYLPPYWALGFQLSRYGYNSLTAMQAAVQRTHDAGIPVDVLFGDIDHMETNKDFTYDAVNYAGLPDYVDHLHSIGMRFITILDPAIMAQSTYWPYTDGLAKDVFIRWPKETNHSDFYRFNSTHMVGYVWPPGEVLFPDFFKNETQLWWSDCIVKHHRDAFPFDGLWIDMNEPANFGTNEDKPWNWPENRDPWSLKCPESPLDDPPYKPAAIFGPRLSEKTLCLVGLQTNGVQNYSQYNVHSLYGWSQTQPSLTAIRRATGERSIVITRSTYIGSGSFAGHWLGDNDSQWPHMHQSIIGCLDFSLFGIAYIGADICGYFSNATAELCNRWTQLGAFYTFSRNHNGLDNRDQDPGAFGPEVAQSAKFVTEVRYSLLPYLYTVFYYAHVTGSTVIRPLFNEFPSDLKTYDVDRQFLWGSALLITPVLEQGETSVCGYLPNARWFSLSNGMEESNTGSVVCFSAPQNRIPLHVRGGEIIVTQDPATNTNRSRLNGFGLVVAPDSNEFASGELFWDDGNSFDSVTKSQFHFFNYTYSEQSGNKTLRSSLTQSSSSPLPLPPLTSVRVFGLQQTPSGVATVVNGSQAIVSGLFYDGVTKELLIHNLTLQMTVDWTVVIWF